MNLNWQNWMEYCKSIIVFDVYIFTSWCQWNCDESLYDAGETGLINSGSFI